VTSARVILSSGIVALWHQSARPDLNLVEYILSRHIAETVKDTEQHTHTHTHTHSYETVKKKR